MVEFLASGERPEIGIIFLERISKWPSALTVQRKQLLVIAAHFP